MNVVTDVFLPLALALMMFAMGLDLVRADFARVAKQPRAFAVGAACQLLGLPIVAFALVSLWTLPAELAVGVIILAACPGGVTSNMMTHLSRGDTALSISLTAIISLLTVFTLPFIVNLGLAWFAGSQGVRLPVAETIAGIFAITTVPVAVGMWVRATHTGFTARIEPTVRRLAAALLIVVVLGAILKERHNVLAYFELAGSVTLALNVLAMGMAAALAHVFALARRESIAITLECGLQNGALAILVAGTLLQDTKMAIPGAIYALLMFASGFGYMAWARSGTRVPAQA